MEMEFREMPGYLRARWAGDWTEAGAEAFLRETLVAARGLGVTKIFLDLEGLAPPTTGLVRYASGIRLAELFGTKYKIAGLGKREHINRLGENTAVNRGARFAMFWDAEQALAWLRDDPAGGNA